MKKLILLLSVLSLLVSSCGTEPPVEETRLQISTSFYPIFFFTSELVQDKGDVVNLTPVGVEPHDYEPTPSDIRQLENSDLVIANGGMEPWLEDTRSTLENNGTLVLVLSETMELLDSATEGEGYKDPHIWLDPKLAEEMVTQIAESLSLTDPQNAEFYQSNATALEVRLSELDQHFSTGLKACTQNTFVSSHTAFAYLAQRYNLIQLPIAGLSPESEPSIKQLSEIVDFVKANNVKVIFFESLLSPSLSDTIANEVGAQTLVLNPLEGLTQQEVNEGKDYFSVMEQNLENLKIALECPVTQE